MLFPFVGAAYGVHPDLRSQSAGCLTLGTVQKASLKLNLLEQVTICQTLWAQNFMSTQGYLIKTSYFAQDNESAITLECNSCTSAGQCSQHIDIFSSGSLTT